ncbi:MAG: ATP-dependent helicase [Actinomycetaceae bacterium]|nr:ATP-dependent helicase [Actinomycetaceae bacterium]MDY6083406.1 ATP-dependent helicase [Actinomycetaceae bacterium]
MRDAEQLLADVDPQQREVVTALRGPVCVRAGAGTGKTRAITYRIAYGIRTGTWKPQHISALTFTARAAGEMRSRLRDLGAGTVSAQTFHAAALRQLRYFWPEAVGGKLPQLVDHKAGIVAEAAGRLGIAADRVTVRDLAAEIEWAKVSLIDSESYAQAAAQFDRPHVADSPQKMAALIEAYEDVKTQRNQLDFEDVLLLMIGIMIDQPQIADQIRAQYRVFVVDEYQDVSPLQHRLLQLWLGGRSELCVVGDVAQTIYSFAGANPHYLAQFTQEFKGATEIELVRDYRSTPQIVQGANRVIAQEKMPGTVQLVSQKESGPEILIHEYADDEDEAADIARRISAKLQQEHDSTGDSSADIAILYRTNAQSAQFEAALTSAHIPYVVRGSERFFSRREVQEAMVAFRAALRDGVAGSLAEIVSQVLHSIGFRPEAPAVGTAARERWQALETFLQMANDMQAKRPGASLRDFVAELEERIVMKNPPAAHGVTLSSLHAAKGLEWATVFLAGMSDGLMPITRADDPAALSEERRLLYVGMTRAKDELIISYARGNGSYGQRKLSRFLRAFHTAARTRPRS